MSGWLNSGGDGCVAETSRASVGFGSSCGEGPSHCLISPILLVLWNHGLFLASFQLYVDPSPGSSGPLTNWFNSKWLSIGREPVVMEKWTFFLPVSSCSTKMSSQRSNRTTVAELTQSSRCTTVTGAGIKISPSVPQECCVHPWLAFKSQGQAVQLLPNRLRHKPGPRHVISYLPSVNISHLCSL